MPNEMQTRTLAVPGATLYLEVRGSGPVLLCISGGPTDAGMFTDIAQRLSDRYTVISYDQRGHSRSTLEGEPGDLSPAVHAEDAAAILRAHSAEPAYVYGVSGGATIGLALVERHPELVRTLVCAEAPLMFLLPDADRWRAVIADIQETFRTEGAFPAMGTFGAMVEEGGPLYSQEMAQAPSTPESEEMRRRMMGNFDLFLAHELATNAGYDPDFERLRAAPTRIVSAVGATSGEQAARRSGVGLAERLGIEVTELPGAHGGWGSDPADYAERVHRALQGG